MAADTKLYHLTRDRQFWEINVRNNETVIRAGKVGCLGRSFPSKKHESVTKAIQFALRQVNAKIMQGFINPTDVESNKIVVNKQRSILKPSPPKRVPSTVKLKTYTPLKKRETIRRLVLQKSMKAQEKEREWEKEKEREKAAAQTNGSNSESSAPPKPLWRKPPKKQSTIRQLMKRMSAFRTVKTASIPTLVADNALSNTPIKRQVSLVKRKAPKRQLFPDCATVSDMASSAAKVKKKSYSNESINEEKLPVDNVIKAEVETPVTLGTVTFMDPAVTSVKGAGIFSPKSENVDTVKDVKTPLAKQDTLLISSSRLELDVKPDLSRVPSLTVGMDNVYIPTQEEWPLQLKAPIIYEKKCPDKNTSAYAVYVDTNRCIFGDDSGRVLELGPSGVIQRQYQLPTEVKCIIREHRLIYVACGDGKVFEISSGIPRCLYVCPKSNFNEVQGLALYNGVLVASNVCGHLTAVNHEGRLLWKRRSAGDGGWMLCIDQSGVYHGHSRGVTKYNMANGKKRWHKGWTCSIFAGVQSNGCIYVAENNRVLRIRKDNGNTVLEYSQEGSGCIMSVALGGTLLFAAGSACITCYDEKSAKPIYKFLHGGQPLSMQYHCGRLYCARVGGLAVMDLSKEAIVTVKRGKTCRHMKLTEHDNVDSNVIPPLDKIPSTRRWSKEAALLECVQEADMVMVKPLSEGFNRSWSCEFPVHLKTKGAKYVVGGLVASETGSFYRVLGNIQKVMN